MTHRRPLVAAPVVLALVACGSHRDDDGPDPVSAVEGLPAFTSVQSVWVFAPDDVWLAVDAGRMLHFDGTRWSTTALDPGVTRVTLWGFAPDDLWAAGGTSVAHYDGSAWVLEDLSPAGVESISALWGTGAGDLWVSGDQSTVAHSDGTAWTRTIAGSTDNVALWGTAADDVWVGGTFDVARFDGAAWQAIDDVGHGAHAIFGTARDDVWVALDERVSHYDGAGWTDVELDGLAGISAMWGERSDDLWGVGDFGVVLHYDGEQWDSRRQQRIGSPYLQSYVDIHGAGDEVWIVGVELGEAGATPLVLRLDTGGG